MKTTPLPPTFLRDESITPHQWYRITKEICGRPIVWKEGPDGWVMIPSASYPPAVVESLEELSLLEATKLI
jgi:hypothetical protein